VKRKFRPPVDYDIRFTDLKDPKATTSSGDLPDNLSEEDLPASIVPGDEPPRSNKRKNDNETAEQSDVNPRKFPRLSLQTSFRKSKENQENIPHEDTLLFMQSDSSDDEGSIEISSPVPSIKSRIEPPCNSWLGKQSLPPDISETIDDLDDLAVLNTSLTEVPVAAEDQTDHVMDEFAELEAWLESGTFEIV
jgi:hypothetical protein